MSIHHNAEPSRTLSKNKYTLRAATIAVLSALATQTALSATSVQNVETIEVRGQVNSLLIVSELDLSTTSSPDLRKQLTKLPSININGNGRVSGMLVSNTGYERSGVKLSAGYKVGRHQASLYVSNRDTQKSGTPALAMDIQFVDALVAGVNY